jgi:hypothetical protein
MLETAGYNGIGDSYSKQQGYYSQMTFRVALEMIKASGTLGERGAMLSLVSPAISVERFGKGYQLTSNYDLATGNSEKTTYGFSRRGYPISRRSVDWSESSPVDCLITTTAHQRDVYMWSRRTEAEQWEENTHYEYTPGNNLFDHPYDPSGFSAGVKALLSAKGLKPEAVIRASEALREEKMDPIGYMMKQSTLNFNRDDLK